MTPIKEASVQTKMATTAAIILGSGLSVSYALSLTKVVLAKTALPGAIKTVAVTINGTPAVLNVMPAAVWYKVIIAAAGIALTIVIALAIYNWMEKHREAEYVDTNPII